MVRSTASRDCNELGSWSASHAQPRAHANSSTIPSVSPTPTCSARSHDSSASTLGAITRDRKSTRLNSSHGYISYAVFCLKKKKKKSKKTTEIHTDDDGLHHV